jgi:septum formation protein
MSKIMMFPNDRIVLASSSPYRKALLDRLQLRYITYAPDIDETPQPDERPEALARRLATEKARAVEIHFPSHLIIGSDQVATSDGATPLGKPLDHVNAVRQLAELSGRRVVFHSAVCLLNSAKRTSRTALVSTAVQFRTLTRARIEAYLLRDRPYDCTGSAKIENLGITLVKKVESDDPTALIGLPLIVLTEMLEAEGISIV